MEKLAQFIGAYATLFLTGAVTGTLLALLLTWTWAGRYGPALRARYTRAADWLHRSSWMRKLHSKAPALERVSLRTAVVSRPLASAAFDGTTTLSPGACAYGASTESLWCSGVRTPPP